MRVTRLPTVLLAFFLTVGRIAGPAESQSGQAAPPRPLLYGVIYGQRGWVAYIEDPATKSVAPYRIGDTVAGQMIQAIEDERVVLTGPEGTLEIRLSDEKPGSPKRPGTR